MPEQVVPNTFGDLFSLEELELWEAFLSSVDGVQGVSNSLREPVLVKFLELGGVHGLIRLGESILMFKTLSLPSYFPGVAKSDVQFSSSIKSSEFEEFSEEFISMSLQLDFKVMA